VPLPNCAYNGRTAKALKPLIRQRLRALVACTVLVLPCAIASLPEIAPPSMADLERALVRLECSSEQNSERHFRGTLIDTGQAKPNFEIILTAAHGLPSNPVELTRSCVVIGEHARSYRIDSVWRPLEPHGPLTDDWAVLRTERRIRGNFRRLRIAQLDQLVGKQMTAEPLPVRLPLLHPPAEHNCSLSGSSLSEAEQSAGLFAHDCRAWQGHSGSPILVSIDEKVLLIGFHLGTRRVFEDRVTLKLGRQLDAAILDAIAAAAGDRRGRDEPVTVAAYSNLTQ